MTTASLRVLLVEDNPGDARLVREFLRDISELELHHVDSLAEGLEHLTIHDVDVILLDLGLPDSQGLETLHRVVAGASESPVIVLTGLDDEMTGMAAVRAGAEDYLAKGEWAGQILPRTIRYALERSENRLQLRRLNQILMAIRGVNQLIVREHDVGRLIQRCCEELVEPGGFDFAMIGLVDKTDTVTLLASSTTHTKENILKGAAMELQRPGCFEVVRQEGVLSGEELERLCSGCPSAELYAGGIKMVARLERRGQVYGFLCVINSKRTGATPDEQTLVQELADDLAFALYGIEEQRRREHAEALIAVRLQLLEFAAEHSIEEVLQKTLDEVENLTQSQMSFYHFEAGHRRTMSPRVWSTRMKQKYSQTRGAGMHKDLENADIWAASVETCQPLNPNDYAPLSATKGFPAIQLEVIRELTIPIYRNEKLVAVLGVGNKPTDYTEEDLGTVTLLADVAWEIAARKRTEADLRDTDRRYRRLFESAQDGILILDADTGIIIDVNPFLSDLLGYSRSAFIGKPLWEIGSFKIIAESQDAIEIFKEKNFFHLSELPLETADGRIVEVEVAGNVFQVDEANVIHCNIRDISERKRAEVERERLLSAIEQAGEMIIITDPEGIIQYVNPAFALTTGYAAGEAVGKSMSILKSGKQERAFYADLWATIISGRTWQGHIVNKRKDGTFYTEDMTISPVRDQVGKIINYVAVKHDITDHLQLESQLRQAQKMESVGRLAGGVAHDFNNMLGVILGSAELAMTMVKAEDPLHEFLREIFNAGKRSAEITRQLLAFARKQTIAPQSLDLNETVDGMLKMLRRLIGEDVCLAWLPETGLWPVRMDPSQIHQILANLCVNARDAIAGVGKITIETGMVTLNQESCDAQADDPCGDFVFLAVTDDGCGMDRQTLENIFEPFFTTKGVGKGTGLGLSTVYGIVKQNNGLIKVFSDPGNGTMFKIYLPRHKVETERDEISRNREIPTGRGETILVVEDEIALLHLIQSMLKRLGYSVLAAATPNEALNLVETCSRQIQLLMTDVVMPEMSGRDLAERLQASYPNIRVLYMSGYTDNIIARQCMLEEGVHFIHKPFVIDDIAIKLRKVLD